MKTGKCSDLKINLQPRSQIVVVSEVDTRNICPAPSLPVLQSFPKNEGITH